MSDEKKIPFIVVDDHPSMRTGLRTVLEAAEEFYCAGEAETVAELRKLVEKQLPQLILMDVNLPESSGFDVFACVPTTREENELNRERPAVLFVSMFLKPNYIVKAVSLGAMGYVAKDSSAEIIRQAARTVCRGHHYFGPLATDALVEWVRSVPNARGLVQNDAYNCLSEREKEVFLLFAVGKDVPQISRELYISRKTVLNYRKAILQSLELESVFELKAFAEEMGII
ncbi:MAG: response regulator transcription factor [Spirochaetia bacterium]|nr:response regulator transcription factor [Spirochaetia bacterium]